MVIEHPTSAFEQTATLCYIFDDEEVLLIWKKRGIGAQQYNAPGGKIEPHDDSPKAAAKREVYEEVRVEARDLERVGKLAFVFGDSPFMLGYVFNTTTYRGDPTETAEARPEWFHVSEIPYDKMWADDRYWMPAMLAGERFAGQFNFDHEGNSLLDWDLEILAE